MNEMITLDGAAAHYNIDWAILSFATSRRYLKYYIRENVVYIAKADLDHYITTYRERCK